MRNFLALHYRTLNRVSLLLLVFAVCFVLAGCAQPSWIGEASALIPVLSLTAGSILKFITALTGSSISDAAQAELTTWVSRIQAELADVQTLIEQYKSAPSDTILAEIDQAVQLVNTDLAQDLTPLGLSPAVTAKVTAWVALASPTLAALVALVPALQGLSTAGAAVPKASTVKDAHNAVLVAPSGDAVVDAAAQQAKL
jgi:hypothetical protein